MKNIITVLGIILLLSSCGKDDTVNTMTVTGKIKGLKKGKLYLQHVPDTVLISLDSLIIDGDGSFTFKTELESPEIFYLYLDKKDNNDINDRITFFGEPGTININTNWNTFDTNVKITGSKSHIKYKEYRKIMSNVNKKSLEIMINALQTEDSLNQVSIDSVERLSVRNTQRGYVHAINFAINNKDSYVAPYIALKEIPDANPKYLDSILSILTPEVAASKYGKALQKYLGEKQ
ncbi:DUF4369 domain-containing protein [Maribacter sp. 2304DJ31-5]|uniref:DUF4369 domain-containing protein n=1 Tax=Maribacter sp. 2304DJ31-5 TaxID=3386273 RepID=UPI0039BD2F6B